MDIVERARKLRKQIEANASSMDEATAFEGKIYESLIDGNVWSPSAYPAG